SRRYRSVGRARWGVGDIHGAGRVRSGSRFRPSLVRCAERRPNAVMIPVDSNGWIRWASHDRARNDEEIAARIDDEPRDQVVQATGRAKGGPSGTVPRSDVVFQNAYEQRSGR